MSLSQHTLKRLPKIQRGLLTGYSREEIGQQCGVTEKTIDRDIKTWIDSGLFETWLREEFVRHHVLVSRKDPVEAYRQLSKLVGRMLTRKAEIKTVEEIREIKLLWIKDESNPPNTV